VQDSVNFEGRGGVINTNVRLEVDRYRWELRRAYKDVKKDVGGFEDSSGISRMSKVLIKVTRLE